MHPPTLYYDCKKDAAAGCMARLVLHLNSELPTNDETMKTIEETYPDHAKDEREGGYFYGPGDYGPLLQSFEYEILLQVDDSDYQGDSLLIYRNGDQYGMLIFGWGSCSGCDRLQACDNMKEIAELRDSLHGQIKWDSLRGLHDYITNKDWELEYSWYADETKDFVEKAKALLGNLLENADVDAPAHD